MCRQILKKSVSILVILVDLYISFSVICDDYRCLTKVTVSSTMITKALNLNYNTVFSTLLTMLLLNFSALAEKRPAEERESRSESRDDSDR
jgi:hypothetical protein